MELAEAFPRGRKYGWRPAKGVRSTSEVFMHIAIANFGLLNITGPALPEGLKPSMETSVTAKAQGYIELAEAIALKRSRPRTPPETPTPDLQRKVSVN